MCIIFSIFGGNLLLLNQGLYYGKCYWFYSIEDRHILIDIIRCSQNKLGSTYGVDQLTVCQATEVLIQYGF